MINARKEHAPKILTPCKKTSYITQVIQGEELNLNPVDAFNLNADTIANK